MYQAQGYGECIVGFRLCVSRQRGDSMKLVMLG